MLGFKGYLFSSYNFHKQVYRLTQGTKIFSININNFKDLYVGIPNAEEQKDIVSLLSKIDERIDAQNKIIEDLETLKKWIINNEMESIKAKEVRLDSISKIYQPKTISLAELNEQGLYNVYGANGIIGRYNEFNHETSQICLTCRGSTCGTLLMSEPKAWITGNAMVINVDEYSNVNKKYLYNYLNTIKFSNIISGSGQPQIVRGPLCKIKIKLPPIEVQEQIANCINVFEEKIKKEKDILSLYKKQKAYLLQNMFI